MFEDDRPLPLATHIVGQDLSTLSLHEITERIAMLRSEIVRLEQAYAAKEASQRTAAAFFKN